MILLKDFQSSVAVSNIAINIMVGFRLSFIEFLKSIDVPSVSFDRYLRAIHSKNKELINQIIMEILVISMELVMIFVF